MCVQHTANISANFSLIFIASNFPIRSVGKLNLWVNSWILSTSSSGVLLDLIHISSLLDPVSLKYRVVHGAVQKFYELSVTLLCSCFLHPMGPKKLSRYSHQLVSTSVSGISWGLYQLSICLMRSCNPWRSLNLSMLLLVPRWWTHSFISLVLPPPCYSFWTSLRKLYGTVPLLYPAEKQIALLNNTTTGQY